MNLGEIVTHGGPEAVSYGRVSLNTLPMPSGFAVRYGFDVNTSAVFPQGVLAPITVVLGGAGERGIGLQPGVKRVSRFAQWLILPY